jgi:putative phosphoribosyl transferase
MFKDRKDAALQLAKALQHYKNTQPIVLGIPRGGAETAFYVARALGAEYSVLVARKLGHPSNPEFAIGAMAEDGSIYLNAREQERISTESLAKISQQQQEEMERRKTVFRQGVPLPSLRDKVVILIDDGIATGATLYASIIMCRKQGVGKLVIAAPVSGREEKKVMEKLADEVVILETPPNFQAVSRSYESFYNLTDGEVLAFLERWKKEQKASRKETRQ